MILTTVVQKILISIGLVVACVFLFIGTFLLNKRTKKPEGCEELNCEGCSMLECSHHPQHNKEEKTEEKGEENND